MYLILLAYIKQLEKNIPEKDSSLTRFIKARDTYDKFDSSDELKLFFRLAKDSKDRGIDLTQVIDSVKQMEFGGL